MGNRIYTVTLNPAWDRTATVARLVPGGTNLLRELRADAGGKGINVSRVLHTFGKESTALGLLGTGAGDSLLARLQDEGICCDFVRLEQDCRTNTKIVDASAGVTTEFNEPGPHVPQAARKMLEDQLRQLPQGAVAVFAGSLPPGVPADWYARAAELCRAAGVRVVLDASGTGLKNGLSGGPVIIKPNRDELEALCGCALDGTEQLLAAARRLLNDRTRLAAVSLGAQGALFATATRAVLATPPKLQAKSTVGAGDTMTAVLADWLAGRQETDTLTDGQLCDLAALAVAAASAKVLREGTQPPRAEEIAAIRAQVCCEMVG